MFKSSWYRLIFANILLIPALLCQTVYPIVSFSVWERVSEWVYSHAIFFQEPHTISPSKILILEVDQKTLDTYGWPVDRTYYVKTLAKLKNSGHPWVLSMLGFQALEKAKASPEPKKDRAAKDQALAKAIKNYDRYIGTGLEIRQGSELTTFQEDKLMPRITLSRHNNSRVELPYLPLTMLEDDRFVEGQRAFGYGAKFGLEPVIYCMPMMITDGEHTGSFVIPSSLVWTAAYATESSLRMSSGASWPRRGEKLRASFKRRQSIAYKHCLTSPSMLTQEFLKERQIKSVSLSDFLTSGKSWKLRDKVVILSLADMRRFRGPGQATSIDDGIVPEHLLAARFLDNLLTGETIRREEIWQHGHLNWLPLAVAGVLSLASLFLSTPGVITLALCGLAGLFGYTAMNLLSGVYVIPVQTMASLGGSAVGLCILYAYLAYHGIRRQVRFTNKLREALSQCNTLTEIESLALSCAQQEFEKVQLEFADYDKTYYLASGDPQAAMRLLDRMKDGSQAEVPVGEFGGQFSTVLTKVKPPARLGQISFRAKGLELKVAIESKLGRLGTMKLTVSYRPHEENFISNLIDTMRVEVSQHWHRIKVLADQKLLDYKFLLEQTRSDIFERFLTHVIVAKFQDNRTMTENLKAVLTPRPTRAALMQADIRGYSKISAEMEPLEMVQLLQSYYSNVVDAAQLVAQVKLIGDCIFLFIEEDAASSDASPVDLCLELAIILIQETNKQNNKRIAEGEDPLYFGIAINYGEVVVGNLSSDSCIDYTVIGPSVNLVARLEELTKNQKIGSAIGANGIILSDDAVAALIKHKDARLQPIDLVELDVAVRSFDSISKVYGMKAVDALEVSADVSTSPMQKAG